MPVYIEEHGDDTFAVTIDGGASASECVLATVTASGAAAANWIDLIRRIHRRRLHCLVVGLDVEWRPNFSRGQENRVAVLQLCVGRRCLVFQTLHADYFPDELFEFLDDGRFTFVGVGVHEDVEKLDTDWELVVRHAQDLRNMAVNASGNREMEQWGLFTLAGEVLGMQELQKPQQVRLSRWDSGCLSWDQIKYAVTDAFLSFEIGRRLIAGYY